MNIKKNCSLKKKKKNLTGKKNCFVFQQYFYLQLLNYTCSKKNNSQYNI